MIFQLPQGDRQVVVLFRLPAHIKAGSIHLVGDFNGWSTRANPMRQGDQYWEARLTLPAGGCYYYAYLVDDIDWCADSTTWEESMVGDRQLVTLIPIDIPQARRSVAAG